MDSLLTTRFALAGACLALVCGAATAQEDTVSASRVPENLYRAEMVSYPGPWSFQIGKACIILVSDQELVALSDPDRVLNLTVTYDKQEASLRQVCERAKAAGQRTLILAFDHFFTQYRPGQAGPRTLMPDMDEYVQRIAAISKFAQGYGLGLELSLLSPLEIGPAYARATGESGLWYHYRKGLRDAHTGAYSVQLWRQRVWTNNKGPINIEDAGVRVFAFHETEVPGTLYRVVDPNGIKEITDTAKVEILSEAAAGTNRPSRIRVYGTGHTDIGPLDRVLVVQQYRTPEMDYFSNRALPFLKSLVDKYADAGVKLNGLYSDEMHIQQDWVYFNHHDNGEFAVRYAAQGIANRYAELYGDEYRDLAKYMIYFCSGQEDFARDLSAKQRVMHVFGSSPEDIRRTALFRSRYFRLLQDGVTGLFVEAKRYAEQRAGYRLEARAHATWAESPTIDYWETLQSPMFPSAYEYTSNFVWSNTVQQAACACDDYFRWGDYLTGNGNDHAEGGYIDRDYFALALACSTGILNEVPYSYCAHWGMPGPISDRRMSLVNAYGAAGSPLFGMVEDMQHRDVQVLMLYPLDLVATDERFGSWMTQYGYANYVTAAKLLERGKVVGGAIEMAGRRFTMLVALFEPFPSQKLLDMMRTLAEGGGRVIWSGPPPVLTREGGSALPAWQKLFGVEYRPDPNEGRMAPGRQIAFDGVLKSVPTQTILTDFQVDHLYPVTPQKDTPVVARTGVYTVGTTRSTSGGGSATFLGFRPRDDQAASLGTEQRTWFEVLSALGAYPGSGRWRTNADNTERISRTTPYLACRFPNGAVAIANHFRNIEETWPGGFARDAKQDEAFMAKHPLPPDTLDLKNFHVNGHAVTFQGAGCVTFRVERSGHLTAFAGCQCRSIRLDGHETVFADRNVPQLAWAPVQQTRRVAGGAVLQIMSYGPAELRIPVTKDQKNLKVYAEGSTPGSRGEEVKSRYQADTLIITVEQKHVGRWLYAAPAK